MYIVYRFYVRAVIVIDIVAAAIVIVIIIVIVIVAAAAAAITAAAGAWLRLDKWRVSVVPLVHQVGHHAEARHGEAFKNSAPRYEDA